MMLLLVTVLVFVVFYLAQKTPTNEANWQLQHTVLPTVEMSGDIISVNNLRDFRYGNDGSIDKVRYLNNQYRLSEFKQAWYGISHFGANNLAHVFISFEFSNKQ